MILGVQILKHFRVCLFPIICIVHPVFPAVLRPCYAIAYVRQGTGISFDEAGPRSAVGSVMY